MTPDPREADDSSQLTALQAEFDNFRAVLCHAFGLYHFDPNGPQGITLVSLASDEELIAEAYRLRHLADQLSADDEEHRASGGGTPAPG